MGVVIKMGIQPHQLKGKSSKSPEQQRDELHAILDFILTGPGPDRDIDAIKALVGIGRLVAAARWAIDHEMGRVLAGRRRSSAYFILADERFPLQQRREVVGDLESYIALKPLHNGKRRAAAKEPVIQQRSLISFVIEAVGWGSGDARFTNLAWALAMLDEGEAAPMLRPAKPRGGRGGHGTPAQITRHRLRAVLGSVYLSQVGSFRSITAARKKIAELYGVTAETMEKWPAAIKRAIGAEELEQELAFAAVVGWRRSGSGSDGRKRLNGLATSGSDTMA